MSVKEGHDEHASRRPAKVVVVGSPFSTRGPSKASIGMPVTTPTAKLIAKMRPQKRAGSSHCRPFASSAKAFVRSESFIVNCGRRWWYLIVKASCRRLQVRASIFLVFRRHPKRLGRRDASNQAHAPHARGRYRDQTAPIGKRTMRRKRHLFEPNLLSEPRGPTGRRASARSTAGAKLPRWVPIATHSRWSLRRTLSVRQYSECFLAPTANIRRPTTTWLPSKSRWRSG